MRSLFVAIAAVLAFALPANAVEQFSTGASLVAPFDATEGKTTFLTIYNPECGGENNKCSLHLSFWGENPVEGEEEFCPHLVDFSTCVTRNDIAVIDVTAMRSQDGNQVEVGPVRNVSGDRGIVVVTAYETDEDCTPASLDSGIVSTGIAGGFTIASLDSQSAIGSDMVVLDKAEDGNYVNLSDDFLDRVVTSSFNPNTLDPTGTYSVVISLAENVGAPAFPGEIGPNGSVFSGSTTLYDNFEVPTSLPDLRTSCVEFLSDGEVIGDNVTVDSSVTVALSNLTVDGLPVGVDTDVWALRAFSLGVFGGDTWGRQIRTDDFLVPTPEPTSSPTPGPTATPTCC